MSKPDETSPQDFLFHLLEQEEINELIDQLQTSHHLRYQLMNLEIWSLVETMDQFLPGFWNRFLENRHKARQQFIEEKQKERRKQSTVNSQQ